MKIKIKIKIKTSIITMSLKVKDENLLKIFNKIWKKAEKLMGINFNSKLLMAMMINT